MGEKVTKIVITGGPGTGKTSIINSLISLGYNCLPEISRQITTKAREEGIEQLFLTKPLLFSEMLLQGRINQFFEADEFRGGPVFLDRGIPDVPAYMDYIGDSYPDKFTHACKIHLYEQVFLLPPWEAIYESDSERYENFEQAKLIHDRLHYTYTNCGYNLTEVPFGTIQDRIDFILKNIVK